ncbi:hypothetical protein [Cerasicoccus fimbriatus]|uniref:hypothetical protein n=1 Tax=Cerasicoccus fimbriatus TaxID=3014554 RepID=UPI0022B41D43|nr:hypothetical protein [Cerasicoccus sp. TK19100]
MGDYTPKPSRRTEEARAERESKAQRAQSAYRWQSAIKKLVIIVLLLGLLAGLGYYVYPMVRAEAEQSEDASTENSISVETIVEKVTDTVTQQAPRDDSYTVTEKVLIPGSLVDKSKDRTQKSKEYADWVDPTYILICRGNTTQNTVYFQTNEEDFDKAFVGANAQHSYVDHWTKLTYEKYLRLTRGSRSP